MLYTRCTIVVNVLLDLTLPSTGGWLIEGHLYCLIPVGHNNGTKGTVLCVHLEGGRKAGTEGEKKGEKEGGREGGGRRRGEEGGGEREREDDNNAHKTLLST